MPLESPHQTASTCGLEFNAYFRRLSQLRKYYVCQTEPKWFEFKTRAPNRKETNYQTAVGEKTKRKIQKEFIVVAVAGDGGGYVGGMC